MIDANTDAVVLGLGMNGASMVRQLSRLGYVVCGVSNDPAEPGWHSRYGAKLHCPHPIDAHDDWVAAMAEIGARCVKRPALMATNDLYVLALDRAAASLDPHFRFHGYGHGLKTQLTGKRGMFELAARHGFPMPATAAVDSPAELEAFCKSARWPVLVKPDLTSFWQKPEVVALGYSKVLSAPTPEALVEAFATLNRFGPRAIAQEVIPGPDTSLLVWIGFVGADGRVRGRTVHRRLRIFPLRYGQSTLAQLADMPEVEAMCERFLAAVGYYGTCGIELKIDARDGQPKLVEVNPRSVGNDAIGIRAGVDFAQEAVASLFGSEPEPRRARHFAQRWVRLREDYRAFKQYRAEGAIGWLGWLGSLRPPITVAEFPLLEDFPYAWANLRQIAGAATRRLHADSRGR